MRKALWLLAALVAASLFSAIGVSLVDPPKSYAAISTVYISDDTGHGSGVHIGRGFVVTAAHVVNDKHEMQVTSTDQRKQKATVLWASNTYDLALLRIDDYGDIATSQLSCAPRLDVGAPLHVIGSPFDLGLFNAWGRVAAIARERGPWKLGLIASLTVAPGMSGGPVLDERGHLVGIVVGLVTAGGFPFAMSFIVPSNAICLLMARQ